MREIVREYLRVCKLYFSLADYVKKNNNYIMCHYCHGNLVHFQFQYCTPTCYMYLLPICTVFHSDLFSTQFSKVLFTWHRHTNQFRSGTNIAIDF